MHARPETGAWRARRWVYFAGPWLVYLGYPLAVAWQELRGAPRVAAVVLLAAFAAAYLLGVPAAVRAGRETGRYLLLAAMLATAAALALLIGPEGLATLVYVAAAAVVLLPGRAALPLVLALAAATTFLPAVLPGWPGGVQWAHGLSVLAAAFIGFAFITLVRSNVALRAARDAVAQLAAGEERLRIARDLHDLLGHSLTTITVKAELAGRLVGRDPDRARTEIADVERLARQSLSDVRATVAGYRDVSLAAELATAREVLGAAGMAAELPSSVDDVPAELRELFGWAVREGVTNAVRHSGAHRVRVSVCRSAVEIVDDGAAAVGSADRARLSGLGLAGLAERAARLGARVQAGPLDGRGFRLRVEVPDAPEAGSGARPDAR